MTVNIPASDHTALEAAAEAEYPPRISYLFAGEFDNAEPERAAFVKGAESRQHEIDALRQWRANAEQRSQEWETAWSLMETMRDAEIAERTEQRDRLFDSANEYLDRAESAEVRIDKALAHDHAQFCRSHYAVGFPSREFYECDCWRAALTEKGKP